MENNEYVDYHQYVTYNATENVNLNLVDLNDIPQLRLIGSKYRMLNNRIYHILNFLNKIPGKEGFITIHYTPASINFDGVERKYFSIENGQKIDAIREKIQDWYQDNQINDNEYFYLIASLLIAVQKVANISGTYGAYNKTWDPRSRKLLLLKFIKVIPSPFEHRAYNEDIFKIVNNINSDLAYIDPPYNTRQ